jgi:hypothetical protein
MLAVDTPIVVEQVDRWEVRALELIMAPDELPRMVVTVVSRYDAGAELGIVWLREQRVEVDSGALVEAWAAPLSGVSLYEGVRLSLYAWLRAAGHVPSDAVVVG